MNFKRTVLLLTIVVTLGLLLGTSAAQAQTVISSAGNATEILDLEVNGVLYNVEFVSDNGLGLYGEPPVFPFSGGQTDTINAANAVNDALNNAEERIDTVGPDGSAHTNDYLIGFDTEEIITPIFIAVRSFASADWQLDFEGFEEIGLRIVAMWAKFTEVPGGGDVPVTIGGSVFGLESLLVLENNGTDWLFILDNGPFEFETPLTEGDSYNVSVLFNLPGETCIVVNGSGVADANVTDIFVVCGPAADPVTIGGNVTGLEGSDLVLQNKGSDDLLILDNGPFEFETPLTPGTSYNVTVLTNPTNPAQECFVDRGSGPVPFEDVTNVAVLCAPPDDGPPPPEEDTVCTRELCAENEELQEQCETFLGTCLELEPENEDECVGGALLICGELF